MANRSVVNRLDIRAAWEYTSTGRKLWGRFEGKSYWFSEWYIVSCPNVEYPPHIFKKLPIIPKSVLFLQILKDPDSVLIR